MRTRTLYIYECLVEYLISIVSTGVFFVALLKEIGMSDALTGILSSMISLGCISQLFSSFLIRKGKSIRKSVLRITVCCDLFFAGVYFLPFVPFKGTAVIFCCAVMKLAAYILMYYAWPTKYRYFNRFVPVNQRGSFCATKEIISLCGGIAFSLAMGWLFDKCNEVSPRGGVLLCGCVILLLAAIQFVLLFLSEEAPEDMLNEEHRPPIQECVALFRDSTPLRKLCVMDILYNFAEYISTPYFAVYLIGDLGFSVTQVTLFSIIYGAFRSFFSKPVGRYGDRKGYLAEFNVGLVIISAAFFINCFTMPSTRLLYCVHYAVYAIAHAALSSSTINVSYNYIPERDYATACGLRRAVGGIAGFIGSLLGGKIVSAMQAGSLRIAFFPYPQQLLSGIALVVMLLLLLYNKTVLTKMPRVQE